VHRRGFLKGAAVAGLAGSHQIFSGSAESGETELSILADGLPGEAPVSASPFDILFHDDFSGFPAGWLSRPLKEANGAIQAYHYLPNVAYRSGHGPMRSVKQTPGS